MTQKNPYEKPGQISKIDIIPYASRFKVSSRTLTKQKGGYCSLRDAVYAIHLHRNQVGQTLKLTKNI